MDENEKREAADTLKAAIRNFTKLRDETEDQELKWEYQKEIDRNVKELLKLATGT